MKSALLGIFNQYNQHCNIVFYKCAHWKFWYLFVYSLPKVVLSNGCWGKYIRAAFYQCHCQSIYITCCNLVMSVQMHRVITMKSSKISIFDLLHEKVTGLAFTILVFHIQIVLLVSSIYIKNKHGIYLKYQMKCIYDVYWAQLHFIL